MTAWTAKPPQSPLTRRGDGRIALVAVAIVAAATGYLLHHLPAMAGHAVEIVAFAVITAAALAAAPAVVAHGRRHAPLPRVIAPGKACAAVESARGEHVDFMAALHAHTLDHGFFVALGPRFLRDYYRSYSDSPHAVALLATLGDDPVGALVGTVHPRAHKRWVVRRRGPRLLLVGAVALLGRPRLALRFARTRSRRYTQALLDHRRTTPRAPGAHDEDATAVLNHVAVLDGARGTGAGTTLVHAFEDRARSHGACRAVLVTRSGSEGAGPFYERLGWRRTDDQRTVDGLPMTHYARRLDRGSTA
ncbi:MAG: GNAT family N-acetyltransferase [Solirubrobacteraceae bacterium MAG38_C4-C5]|nr:GNAT family N-acetyltransferase [Candidatus Siliceabacter maunaloa]